MYNNYHTDKAEKHGGRFLFELHTVQGGSRYLASVLRAYFGDNLDLVFPSGNLFYVEVGMHLDIAIALDLITFDQTPINYRSQLQNLRQNYRITLYWLTGYLWDSRILVVEFACDQFLHM